MTIYKLVTMDAPIWGLGERLEDCLIAVIVSRLFPHCNIDVNLAQSWCLRSSELNVV
jgi:hypothetical protein